MKRRTAYLTSLIDLGASETPPTEFRIWRAGKNETTKGTFIFDAVAAKYVMGALAAHNVDLMIDLEHLSVDDKHPNYDPDARGWCRLEVRDGELWAVDVRWTPDGAARLSDRRQRYVSPFFSYDPDTRRLTDIHNIAITAMPATDNAAPLVAASSRSKAMAADSMTGLMQLGLQPEATLEEILQAVADLNAKLNPTPEPAEGASGATPQPDPEKEEMKAATSSLIRITGEKTAIAALSVVERWKTGALAADTDRQKNETDRKTLEAVERRELVTKLVVGGALTPAMAWENADAREVASEYRETPIARLREKVAALPAAPSPKRPALPVTATALSAREIERCKANNIDPEKYAATKAKLGARTIGTAHRAGEG